MNVYHRYFRATSGPLLDEVNRLIDERDAAGKALIEFGNEFGCIAKVWRSGGIAGFHFDKLPDQRIWRTKDTRGLYWPRKNTLPGKAMWARIRALPDYPDLQIALKAVGLDHRFPSLIDQSTGYWPVLWGFPNKGVLFVKVPWRDIDPDELQEYREDEDTSSIAMEHLLWEAPSQMEEIRLWELMKEEDELATNDAPKHTLNHVPTRNLVSDQIVRDSGQVA